ncbi:cell division protein FtsW, partial [Halobellus sp. Atlit-31R]
MAFQIPFKFSGSSSDASIAARSRPSKMMDYDQPLVWVTVLLMMFGLV